VFAMIPLQAASETKRPTPLILVASFAGSQNPCSLAAGAVVPVIVIAPVITAFPTSCVVAVAVAVAVDPAAVVVVAVADSAAQATSAVVTKSVVVVVGSFAPAAAGPYYSSACWNVRFLPVF